MAAILWTASVFLKERTDHYTTSISLWPIYCIKYTTHTVQRDITLTWTSCDWSTKTDTQSDTCSHSQNGWTNILSAGPEDSTEPSQSGTPSFIGYMYRKTQQLHERLKSLAIIATL